MTPLEHRYLQSAWRRKLRREGVRFGVAEKGGG